jgi:hypothetical protein
MNELVMQLITALGPTGALVWYLWQTTSKTIPNLIEQHNKTMDVTIQKFTASLEEERKARKGEVEALREWIRIEAGCRYNKDHPGAIKN